MLTPHNTFKQSLHNAELQIGLWLALANSYSAELCATCGFDWLLIDGEHAPVDLRTILASLQAVAAYSSHPVVRIPKGDEALIKQVLELGATTLLVPMVDSADEAQRLVRTTRYPPEGIRGVGSGVARSSRWTQFSDYVSKTNDEVCLLVQAETQEALANIEEIAAVDGVDGVFIGPSDLAASMGLLGQPSHLEVRKAVIDGLQRIARTGKAAGVLCADEPLARVYIEAGARFVAVGIDTSLLLKSAASLADRFKHAGDAVN
ncbi:2,4-dihydroxyhept-2-ene-1,7-dioic acid aldolase [Paraburkholderia steynii]|uniref:2,4-dihydroxyhept-2-ene-1,7-dioic acid aldolase n=1 Tax=Paraburkholderia steynii TaxID=1245441 RepID=A0A4R0XFC6_9BURK|nr:2,4-dihydroxyhept-2-ene-1,7-dioic acid aldolase [Paraburkholderia steynii]